jgi:hypothetical protein
MSVSLSSAFTNAGTINLLATGLNHNITFGNNSTLNNIGTLTINPGPTADGTRAINLQINDSGTFNVNASTTINNNFTNTGNLTIANSKTLSSAGGSTGNFTQSAGTLAIGRHAHDKRRAAIGYLDFRRQRRCDQRHRNSIRQQRLFDAKLRFCPRDRRHV